MQSPMKNLLLSLLLAFSAAEAASGEEPSGEYVELHACEVYTGGCTASAQATLGGRSVLRVWNFQSGKQENVELAGLTVVALEIAEENLAMPGIKAAESVAYLPDNATPEQRDGLLSWLASQGVTTRESRILPVAYHREGARIFVNAGPDLRLSTRALEACDAGGCGEQLWYEPRGTTGGFTVLVNDHSQVIEPLLKLTWKDHSAKSVFFGRFGLKMHRGFHLAGIL